jgi:hypothetical protein
MKRKKGKPFYKMLVFADRIAIDALLFTSVSCFIALFSDMGLYKRALFLFPMLFSGLLLFIDMLGVVFGIDYFQKHFLFFKASLIIQLIMVIAISAVIILPQHVLDNMLNVLIKSIMGIKNELKTD